MVTARSSSTKTRGWELGDEEEVEAAATENPNPKNVIYRGSDLGVAGLVQRETSLGLFFSESMVSFVLGPLRTQENPFYYVYWLEAQKEDYRTRYCIHE
jgi:hypothetical protein